jgi:hypothetical protein
MKSTRLILRDVNKNLPSINKLNIKDNSTTCPHFVEAGAAAVGANDATIINAALNAKPYSQVPGPKPLPILGNTWR